MNKLYHFLYLLFFLLISAAHPAHAQGINFQMVVEPEISASVLQNIDFGQLIANSGRKSISRESSKAGVFQIKGLPSQQVLVSLSIPDYLSHATSGEGRIPIDLQAVYNNRLDNQFSTQPIEGNTTSFSLQPAQSSSDAPWTFAYIYMFGSTTVGEVSDGDYTGHIVLRVEYQ